MRSERINALASICAARTYLEIGVCRGETFFDVNVPYKVAVDPNFLFDHAKHEDYNTVFHSKTSDAFFENKQDKLFDLIYLDGLHTFEQTTRDFLNSINVSHDRTIWLFDDTVPHDVFSAMPDQQSCYKLRHKLAQGDWFWMGDVYKTIFFIKCGFPFFQFRTFSGHGQTVCWKSKHARNMNSIEIGMDRIGAMTYVEFIDRLDDMNIRDDQSIYEAVRRAFD